MSLKEVCRCLQANYAMPLDVYYEQVLSTAEECNAAMLAPWQLLPFHTTLGKVKQCPAMFVAEVSGMPHLLG